MKDFIRIQQLGREVVKKCDCCDKVQAILYRIDILKSDDKFLLQGDLLFCKDCGDNFSKIITGEERTPDERVVKSFTF